MIDQDSHPLENRLVGLLSQKGRVLYEPAPVASTFEESFVVSPYRETYVVNIECPGVGTAAVTVHYGRDVGPAQPLELGRFLIPQQSE